tara:strand:+ start:145 stop:783 length:639 start_codon:yes stop_codon:yes gene_type:complete
MIQYYQFKNRAISKLVSIFKKNNNVLIYGPQRSFTNFFHQYLERNFFVNIKKGTVFKNLDHYKHNPKPDLDKKTLNNSVIFILYKDLDLWIKSLERNPMDFFEINKLFNYNISNTKEVEKITQYHKNFYDFWIKKKNFSSRIEFVDYQEMLDEGSIHKFTKYIKLKYKFLSYKRIYIPKKVRFSENFNKQNYKIFVKEDCSLRKQIQSLIKR